LGGFTCSLRIFDRVSGYGCFLVRDFLVYHGVHVVECLGKLFCGYFAVDGVVEAFVAELSGGDCCALVNDDSCLKSLNGYG